MRYRKRKIEKEGKINLSTMVLFSELHLVVLIMYTKILDMMSKKGAEKSVKEILVREKENKGTDKQYVADSLIHSTTVHYQALYQISRSYVK